MKFIILVGDGMGDLPLADLGNKTPLEAARTPAMDDLAAHGELHRLQTIPQGFSPGSDVANLSLLGYLPGECYTGRAPLEAASMGVELSPEAVAFRCNLVTLEKDDKRHFRMADYSAGHISTEEARLLIEHLDKNLADKTIRFYPGVSYRHLLVHEGPVSGLETVPPHDHSGQDVTKYWRQYLATPSFRDLVPRARELLELHEVNRRRTARGQNPANAIWLWGEGRAPSMPTLREQFGITGTLISAVDLLRGIGVYAGLDIIRVPGATGYLDTNYEGKATAALDSLKKRDFVFVHVEAPDEAGHQGLLSEKIRAIEDFDQRIVKPIFEGLNQRSESFRLVVTMDHFTPISIRTHSNQPVPFLLYDSGNRRNSGPVLSEKNAEAYGGNVLADGRAFMNLLLGR